MRVLLLSMPDSFEHMPPAGIRLPTCALTSLAGNVDSHHIVGVLDLILVQQHVQQTLDYTMQRFAPDVVGLSVMTFQRHTAKRIINLLRSHNPAVRIVVGGYDPSLAPEAYTNDTDHGVDFVVRGEGEITLRELLRAIEHGSGYEHIAGLSYRTGDCFTHNPDRPVHVLDDNEIRPPDRSARILDTYTTYGRKSDVIETSRGCTFHCGFCSIVEMRGRNFYTYPLERVIADIRDARECGARALFFVDDNVMLDVKRFEALCQAIIDEGLTDIDYSVQAMTAPLAHHGERLAPLMQRAGFTYVFLGIENILDADLHYLGAHSKNTRREHGRRAGNASVMAIENLHRHGIYVIGGLIVGNPDDTCESIQANLAFARQYIDWPYIQHPTPYPRTRMAQDFAERNLIVNHNLEEYDGTTAVIRTNHLSASEVEFMRWQAERWLKLRHMILAGITHPSLLLLPGNIPDVVAYIFRGTTLETLFGLEDEYRAFERYRARRRTERHYL